jgi:hypothetical protein
LALPAGLRLHSRNLEEKGCKRRESTTAFFVCKHVLALKRDAASVARCCVYTLFDGLQKAFQNFSRNALTRFSILSNIRRVSGGSRGMVRTSRCCAGIFFQFGGPNALSGGARFHSSVPLADLPFDSLTYFQEQVCCVFLDLRAGHVRRNLGRAKARPYNA